MVTIHAFRTTGTFLKEEYTFLYGKGNSNIKSKLRQHFGANVYGAARGENDLRFYCVDVKVAGVNKSLGMITVMVKEVMGHRMYHMVYIL